MEKARRMGFDVKEMRIAASMLYDFQHGKPLDLVPYYAGLKEWFEFRRAATTEHLLDFVQAVKEVNPELETGIYIFAPALADLVRAALPGSGAAYGYYGSHALPLLCR